MSRFTKITENLFESVVKAVLLVAGLILFLTGVFMTFHANASIKLDNFDDLWNLGEPVVIETEFRKLLPQAESLKNKSIYLQILSQIALTQALQKRFDDAHKTLNNAEALLTPEYELAHVRILLERGRVFQQAAKIPEARVCLEQSFELSTKHNFDFHTINAAHMIAIVASTTTEKITWNQRALDLAAKTQDQRAQNWLGSLYNNLGQNYLEAKQFEKALAVFQKALECREKEDYAPNIRYAKWSVARALRSLGRLDEALTIQNAVLKDYDAITKSSKFDMPVEMFTLTRGLVYEELAEIYTAKAKVFSNLAYDDLSNNVMFKETTPERLERLKQLKN